MNHKEFDIIFNQKLQSYTASVPAGLWEKIAAQDLSGPTDPFDEFIHHKLYHHTAPIPEGLWDKVKPTEEKKRRPVIFWLPKKYMVAATILIFVLAGSVSAYLYLNDFNWLNSKPTEESINAKQPVKIDSTNEPSVQKNTVLTESASSIANPSAPNQPTNSLSPTAAEDAIEKASPETSVLNFKKTNQASNNNWKLNRKNMTQSFKQKESVFPFEQSIKTNQQNQTSQSSQALTGIDQDSKEDDLTYELTNKAGDAYIKQQRQLAAYFKKDVLNKNHASSFKNVVICPTDRKMRNPDWDLEVYVSPDLAFKSVTSNTASQAFLSRKDSNESMRMGFSAGFRIVKPLNDNFSLKTGLQYSQINERFSYRTENETRTTTVVTVRSIIRAPGDTLIVRDTSTLTQIGYKNNTEKNRFRSLDIPVLASYQLGNDDLRFGITAGVIVNVSSWYQGVILDSSLSPVPLNKDNNMVYKSNIGLGLYAGFNISKRINYATQLFFEPYLRYNLSNMTNPEAAFNQRFSIGGLSMGLRFNLNKR